MRVALPCTTGAADEWGFASGNTTRPAHPVGPDADTRKISCVRDPLCLAARNVACEIQSQKAVAHVDGENPHPMMALSHHDAPMAVPHRHDHRRARMRLGVPPELVIQRQLDALDVGASRDSQTSTGASAFTRLGADGDGRAWFCGGRPRPLSGGRESAEMKSSLLHNWHRASPCRKGPKTRDF
jgi:hypothetical protein